MTAEKMNQAAFEAFEKQNWEKAQELLYKNIKQNPCHQTFNNLGYFLATEGLVCKNGKYRSAVKLGLHYLKKASEYGCSENCTYAQLYVIDRSMGTLSHCDCKNYIKEWQKLIEKQQAIKNSPELQYNLLRLRVLRGESPSDIYKEIQKLVAEYAVEESVELYLEVLRKMSFIEEGKQCISQYGALLDEVDLLIFYSSVNLYYEGVHLCDSVLKKYAMDSVLASALIECCVNTEQFDKAIEYARIIRENQGSYSYNGASDWCDLVFEDLRHSSSFRKKLITDYFYIPQAIIPHCCYFGCEVHHTPWEIIQEKQD